MKNKSHGKKRTEYTEKSNNSSFLDKRGIEVYDYFGYKFIIYILRTYDHNTIAMIGE